MPRRKKKVKHRPKDPKWHARRILEHKTQDNTPGLPPIVSSGDGGQPLFAFLSSNKFTTRKSKIAAIDFYTQSGTIYSPPSYDAHFPSAIMSS